MRELPDDLVDELVAAQLDSGAIASVLVESERRTVDQNGFTTAQVLDAVAAFAPNDRIAGVIERGLDFLETCEAPEQPGAFTFWPPGLRPARIPPFPPDADDTALIGWQLVKAGRRDKAFLRTSLLERITPFRVPADLVARPTWVCTGAFWTWLDPQRNPNTVDCTVNANVVGVMAWAHLRATPGYQQACEMIANGIVLAWEDDVLIRLLSPYYPHPVELLYAVRRAVLRGALELRPSLGLLEARWGSLRAGPESAVFTSAFGKRKWRCAVLQRIRACATEE